MLFLRLKESEKSIFGCSPGCAIQNGFNTKKASHVFCQSKHMLIDFFRWIYSQKKENKRFKDPVCSSIKMIAIG